MKRYSTIMSVLLTLALPVAGTCAEAPNAPEKADKSMEAVKSEAPKGGHGKMMGMGAAPEPSDFDTTPTGKVLETMNSGGYTYANIEGNGTKTWVAYPVLETRIGDTLTFKNCMPMANFQSKTLNRTFEKVLFCGAPEVAGAKAPAAKEPVKKAAATGGKIKVDKAAGANAYTIEEIFEKRSSLSGKQVVVKGQVVKASSGIMNTNWYHLQDGTGSDSKKTNDLTITSNDNAEVGDVVTVSGTLSKDKDFGGGYKYNVIIEKGSLKK